MSEAEMTKPPVHEATEGPSEPCSPVSLKDSTEAASVQPEPAPLVWWWVTFRKSKSPRSAFLGAAILGPVATLKEAAAIAKIGGLSQRGWKAHGRALTEGLAELAPWAGRLLDEAEAKGFMRERAARQQKARKLEPTVTSRADARADLEAPPPRPEAPTRVELDASEEAPLLFYFGEGQTISERSTAGAMLENHSMYNEQAIHYENALRSGRAKLPHGETFERLGWPELEYGKPEHQVDYDEAGAVVRELDAIHNSAGEAIGYLDPETIEITAESKDSQGVEPNIKAMMRWADVDELVRMLLSLPGGLAARDVLRVVYGPEGTRFLYLALSGEAAFSGHGRLAALYVRTDAGKRLLEWSDELRAAAGQPPFNMSLQERMEAEMRDAEKATEFHAPKTGRYVGLRKKQARDIRRAMLDKARREALPELWFALGLWRTVFKSAPDKPARWTGKRADDERRQQEEDAAARREREKRERERELRLRAAREEAKR